MPMQTSSRRTESEWDAPAPPTNNAIQTPLSTSWSWKAGPSTVRCRPQPCLFFFPDELICYLASFSLSLSSASPLPHVAAARLDQAADDEGYPRRISNFPLPLQKHLGP